MTVRPLTAERWEDLEALFGPRGAVGGCWCMWWRQSGREHELAGNEGNRQALRRLVEHGVVPGLLAYAHGEPVGWVSVGPREEFPRLNRSPVLKPVDGRPAWSVVCLYVRHDRRDRDIASELLAAAVEHARAGGAEAVEGYPLAPAPGRRPYTWTGVARMFERLGFEEIACRRERPIVRLEL